MISELLGRLRTVLPESGRYALHEPEFGDLEWRSLRDCLSSGFVSSVGPDVERFEQMLCTLTGARHAIAVVNGTAALHICLLLAGVQRDDEVLLPSLTFVATANAVSYCSAVPHFVDSEADTLGVDAVRLEGYLHATAELRAGHCYNRSSGRRIRVLLPMHVFGHPCDIAALAAVAARWSLVLVEDAAESLGSWRDGIHTGNTGLLAALSFNGNKIVTTGGGGAILTSSSDLAIRAKHLTTTARVRHEWAFLHDEVGFNYRMPNLNAALGCAQLEALPRFIEQKRALAVRYERALAELPDVKFVCEPARCRSNYWLNALLLSRQRAPQRDAILAASNAAGIHTRPVWTLMHRLPMYSACPRMELPVAEDLERRLINLPSSARLGA